ncbi:Vacuolar protein sorting-associated protein 53 [Tilletia horrida]|uniref:Vacuolar protein sorting-associated protein 53 n=1 Tax=Tilletia horrida TaxID=155126 RepID=A0AAN6GAW2_9BASI|nr:Vacuolar protein sorting-associated protein 53 [Tilletia horrida]
MSSAAVGAGALPAASLSPELSLRIGSVLGHHQPAPAAAQATASTNKNVVGHLNALFPDAEDDAPSLEDISQVHERLRAQLSATEAQVDALIVELKEEQDVGRMSKVQGAIAALLNQLAIIREEARESEMVVREITRDIRSLDTAKKNVVASMTALKRLQMLVNAADQLERLTQARRYKEASQALEAIKSLQNFFNDFMRVERIAEVWKQVAEVQTQLRTSVMEDYEKYFLHDAASPLRNTTLPAAALVVDALGPAAVSTLLDWYVALQLREYRRIFRATDEAGQLDNVARRFAWFRRVLKGYEDEHREAFLAQWGAERALVRRWAEMTREDLRSVLIRDQGKLQVSVLLEALEATLEFQAQLAKKFNMPFQELATNPAAVAADADSSTGQAAAQANVTLSSVFEPYLSIFVDAQDRTLAEMVANFRRIGANLQNAVPDAGDGGGAGGADGAGGGSHQPQHHTVLPSSTELFFYYRQTLEQFSRLSNGESFAKLCAVFRKWLTVYAEDVLRPALMRNEPSRRSLDSRPSTADAQRWCLVLNTADYCATTTSSLESKLKEKIKEELRDGISFEGERQYFLGICAAAVSVLAREAEILSEPAFNQMLRPAMPWSQIDAQQAGEQASLFVNDLASHLEQVAVIVREEVENVRFVRNWCDKTVGVILGKFTHTVVRLRPVAKTTAQQLLRDVGEIKSILQDLPRYGSEDAVASARSSYLRYVTNSVGRIETLLRVIMIPESPPEDLVNGYIEQVKDRSFSNFQKILDLKGVRRMDQNGLMDKFLAISSQHERLASESFLTSLDMDPNANKDPNAGFLPDGTATPPAASGRTSFHLSRPGDGTFSPAGGTGGAGPSGSSSSEAGMSAGAGRALSDLRRIGNMFGAALGRSQDRPR